MTSERSFITAFKYTTASGGLHWWTHTTPRIWWHYSWREVYLSSPCDTNTAGWLSLSSTCSYTRTTLSSSVSKTTEEDPSSCSLWFNHLGFILTLHRDYIVYIWTLFSIKNFQPWFMLYWTFSYLELAHLMLLWAQEGSGVDYRLTLSFRYYSTTYYLTLVHSTTSQTTVHHFVIILWQQ